MRPLQSYKLGFISVMGLGTPVIRDVISDDKGGGEGDGPMVMGKLEPYPPDKVNNGCSSMGAVEEEMGEILNHVDPAGLAMVVQSTVDVREEGIASEDTECQLEEDGSVFSRDCVITMEVGVHNLEVS